MSRSVGDTECTARGNQTRSGRFVAGACRGPADCPADCLVRDAVAGLEVGFVLLDLRGRILWLNPAAERLLGVGGAAYMHRPLGLVLRDPQLSAFWQDHRGTEGAVFANISVRHPEPMDLKLHLAPCRSGADSPRGRVLLVCDVTQERKAQVELSRAVADRLLALTSGHMPPQPVAHLTSQELRVLRLVGGGLGNDEIARRMAISVATVRSHLKRLYRKLHLRSRAEAVSFATRNHLS
jgi:DNA-binding CsgD family transcriptional regulator